MTEDKTVYWGYWWLPGEDPERDAQRGSLTVEPDDTMQLSLVGGFPVMEPVPVEGQPGVNTLRDRGTYPVIFGRSGSQLFTLLGTHTSHARNGFVDRPELHVLSPQRALYGNVLLDNVDQPKINGISLQIDYLLFFSRLSVFEFEDLPTRDVGEISSTGTVRNTTSHDARWHDAAFSLNVEFSDFFPGNEDPNTQELASRQRAVLDVRFDEPRTLTETDLLSKKLQDLLTLAVNRPCGTRAANYKITASEPTTDWEREEARYLPEFNVGSYGRQIYRADSDAYRDPRAEVLFTVDQLPFAQVVPRWLDLYDKAAVGLGMLSGLRYLNVGYLATRLTTVCIALEALHTSLYDHPLMPNSEFEEFFEQAKAGVEKKAHRAILHKVVKNRIDYRDRARELAEMLDPAIVETVIGDVDQWIELVTKTRNHLAHANPKGHNVDFQLHLLQITQIVLWLVVGRELGLQTATLLDFAQRMWGRTALWKEVLRERSGGPT